MCKSARAFSPDICIFIESGRLKFTGDHFNPCVLTGAFQWYSAFCTDSKICSDTSKMATHPTGVRFDMLGIDRGDQGGRLQYFLWWSSTCPLGHENPNNIRMAVALTAAESSKVAVHKYWQELPSLLLGIETLDRICNIFHNLYIINYKQFPNPHPWIGYS